VGYTAQENVTDANALGSNRYPNNQVPYLSAVGNLITSGTATHEEWSIVSQLGRINYNFDDKYLITTSIRRDGSSRFGANNKYAVFPSGAVHGSCLTKNSCRAPVYFSDETKAQLWKNRE
jgi:hypothetical protein